MRSSSDTFLPGLDHLRAVAAFMVLYFHTLHSRGIGTDYVPSLPPLSLLEEGYTGVQLFICITGFIFTILTAEREVDYVRFLRNRLLRVFPLTFLMTLFVVSMGDAGGDTLFLMLNMLGAGGVAGTWTVILEFQFYLAYPFLRRTLYSSALRRTILRCLGLVLLFILLRSSAYAIHGTVQHMSYWTMIGEADCFLFGIIAGAVYLHVKDLPQERIAAYSWLVLIAAAAALIFSEHWFNASGGFYFRPTYPSPSRLWILRPTLLGILFSGMVCSYCLISRRWNGRFSRAVAYLGAISFSTYLLHFQLLQLGNYVWHQYINWRFVADQFWNETLITVLFFYPPILLASAVSYELFEKAFLLRRVPYLLPTLPVKGD